MLSALCQHSGPYPVPLGIGSVYGSGLFWCKVDDILQKGPILTATILPSGMFVEVHFLGPTNQVGFSCVYLTRA